MKKNRFLSFARVFGYLFVVVLPFQVRSLVFGPSMFGGGFFNPYLSHYLWLGDLFLVVSLILVGIGLLRGHRQGGASEKIELVRVGRWFWGVLGGMVGVYLLSVVFAGELWGNSLVYCLRIFEFGVVGVMVGMRFLWVRRVLYAFVMGVGVASVVGIFQFIFQESVGLWFLGESVVGVDVLGVAKVELFGVDFIRSYGTFPHPNIFAGYLVFGVLGVIWLMEKAGRRERWYLWSMFCLFLVALVLTFSRSGILALLVGLLVWKRRSWWMWVGVLLVLMGVLGLRLFELDGVVERMQYFAVSWNMFAENWFGVGAGNFTGVMAGYSDVELAPWQIQPVHNVFMLALNEIGVVGLVALCLLFVRGGWKFGLPLLVLGMFDHYLLSLYQGQALLFLVIGFKEAVKWSVPGRE